MKVTFVECPSNPWTHENPWGVTRFFAKHKKIDLSELLERIKSDEWAERVNNVRQDLSNKTKHKEMLDWFHPACVYQLEPNKIELEEDYNGMVCLDIDDIENPEAEKNSFKKIPWVHAVFITPSGKGLKVFVKTDSSLQEYVKYANSVAKDIKEMTGLNVDERAKEKIFLRQFVSHDPDLYYNPSSEIYVNNN